MVGCCIVVSGCARGHRGRVSVRPAERRSRSVGTSAHAQSAATDDHRPHPATTSRDLTPARAQGETLNGQRLIEFRLGHEAGAGERLRVLSAELMVRAEASSGAGGAGRGAGAGAPGYTLWAFTVAGNRSVGALAGAARRDPRRAWQRLDVTQAARRWAGGGGGGGEVAAPLRLLLDCSGCAGRVRLRLGGGQAARPLLRLRVEPAAPRRRRHALDCLAAPRGHCCRQTQYVSFRELGWDDWIVAPEGYYANYCRGACARARWAWEADGASGGGDSNHAQVAAAARLQPAAAACCAPLRYSALSLIYFGEGSNIIKRDLPEMVVEECGCP